MCTLTHKIRSKWRQCECPAWTCSRRCLNLLKIEFKWVKRNKLSNVAKAIYRRLLFAAKMEFLKKKKHKICPVRQKRHVPTANDRVCNFCFKVKIWKIKENSAAFYSFEVADGVSRSPEINASNAPPHFCLSRQKKRVSLTALLICRSYQQVVSCFDGWFE